MTYITLNSGMDLIVTKRDTIYRGDNMADAITFLLPLKVGNLDTLSTTVFLSYIRADGTPDIVVLEPEDEMYDANHYKYVLPVTCKLSRYPGDVCMWLQFYSGDPDSPAIAKSGECTIKILNSKSMDDCLCDHQLSAIYQIKKQLDELSGENNSSNGSSGGNGGSSDADPDDEGFEVVVF